MWIAWGAVASKGSEARRQNNVIFFAQPGVASVTTAPPVLYIVHTLKKQGGDQFYSRQGGPTLKSSFNTCSSFIKLRHDDDFLPRGSNLKLAFFRLTTDMLNSKTLFI